MTAIRYIIPGKVLRLIVFQLDFLLTGRILEIQFGKTLGDYGGRSGGIGLRGGVPLQRRELAAIFGEGGRSISLRNALGVMTSRGVPNMRYIFSQYVEETKEKRTKKGGLDVTYIILLAHLAPALPSYSTVFKAKLLSNRVKVNRLGFVVECASL